MKPLFVSILLCILPAGAQGLGTPAAAVEALSWKEAANSTSPVPEQKPEEVFDRLAALLEEIPKRWESLSAPVVPVSGRLAEEIIASATERQRNEARGWIIRLSSVSPDARATLIDERLRHRSPTEVGLWLPFLLSESQKVESFENAAGKAILALSLGPEENHPAFLRINLVARTVDNLGFSPDFYQTVFRSPRGTDTIVALEGATGQAGWDLALADVAGKLLKSVQRRPEDDLLPAWQPNGVGLAFVAELPRDKPRP